MGGKFHNSKFQGSLKDKIVTWEGSVEFLAFLHYLTLKMEWKPWFLATVIVLWRRLNLQPHLWEVYGKFSFHGTFNVNPLRDPLLLQSLWWEFWLLVYSVNPKFCLKLFCYGNHKDCQQVSLVEAGQVLGAGDKDMFLCPSLISWEPITRKAYEYKVTFIISCCSVQFDHFLSV